MFNKLDSIKEKYEQLKEDLCKEEVYSDMKKTIQVQRDLNNMEEVYELYIKWLDADNQIKDAKEMISTETDDEMIELAKEQLDEATPIKEEIEANLKIALLPKDPNDDKNIFMEIRPAAGGDEAGLFATELLRMYLRYAEIKGWKAVVEEEQMTGNGGLKFALVKIVGDKVYSKLKYESGVHRVQRIPVTESTGRIHTSTATVAVLPEIDDVDFKLDLSEVEIDTYAASSAGGQHANKNESGVRLRHLPTGIIITCSDGRSQLKNKEKAFSVLKAKLYQIEVEEQQKELREERLYQLGTGDRSEKIRTYNYPQDRVTDHRIKQSWPNLPGILDGEIESIIEGLILEDQAKLMSAGTES